LWHGDEVKRRCRSIFLLDLFDFWFEYKAVVPKGFVRVLGKLAEIRQWNSIYFFVGNHDLWMELFQKELNIPVFMTIKNILWDKHS
jgi:UDP-2,3-diacylglucosamine hydrolase